MLFTLGQQTVSSTINTAAWTLLTFATPGRVRLRELGVCQQGSVTGATFGLGRPAAVGITPTTPVDFLAEDPTDTLAASTLQGVVAGWGTQPTVPTAFFRTWSKPAVLGAGVIWTWPKGLMCAISGNLVLWEVAACGVNHVYALCEII